MNEPIEVFIPLIFIFLIVLVIDYLKNHCPQCKAWHPFRSGLIVLEKHSDKFMKEWVKCKNCSHEWEKTVKGDDTSGGGV